MTGILIGFRGANGSFEAPSTLPRDSTITDPTGFNRI